jgi:xanthine dehydrogenase YagS FAD-binding subunit
MDEFVLQRAASVQEAVDAMTAEPAGSALAAPRFLAGGTTLVDLMKLNVERPGRVVDINRLPLAQVEPQADGGVRIGALVRNADLAHDATIRSDYPMLSQAILSGASAQIRNMATTAGNLLQRTRCAYFRDTAAPCNKRVAGSGCAAIGGMNRNLAILGTSASCIASHPSDMCVAMAALDATIHVTGRHGQRSIPIGAFHRLPGDTPQVENALEPGDLITHVTLPGQPAGVRSTYLKLRDRASYEFALASAAVAMKVDAERIVHVRVAMGGVGTRPWRAPEAEAVLVGQSPGTAVFRAAAEAALRDARPQSGNGFKVELMKRCLVHAMQTVTQSA